MSGRSVVISGTDPSNPRNAGQMVEQLKQIETALEALSVHAVKLAAFTGGIRDVMLDQGRPLYRANDETERIAERIRGLSVAIDLAKTDAAAAGQAIVDSGVILRGSFEWRPGVPGRR